MLPLTDLFPGVRFTGAFLTEDLKHACLIPLLFKAAEQQADLEKATLCVTLVDGWRYEAAGEAVLDWKPYEVIIAVLPPTEENKKLSRCFVDRPDIRAEMARRLNLPMQELFPRFFYGIDQETYVAGELQRFTLKAC